jgi:hypothetical protein
MALILNQLNPVTILKNRIIFNKNLEYIIRFLFAARVNNLFPDPDVDNLFNIHPG